MERIVLVTGASKGIGSAIAKTFLDNGDIVYINYNSSYEEAKQFLKYEKAHLIKADVANENEVIKMIDDINNDYGKLDVVINNAGIAIDTTWEDKTIDNFKKILNVNLLGPFLVSKYASEIMNKGSIINISSTNAIDSYYPYSLDYDASKAGLNSLTHNLAVILAPNIRVNAVAPGWIDTDMNKNLDEEYKKAELKKILVNRFGRVEEIAEVVFFLTSEKASYINNTIIRVDGGFFVK